MTSPYRAEQTTPWRGGFDFPSPQIICYNSLAAGAGEVASLYSVTYNTNNSTSGTTPATQTAESNSETYTFVVPTADQYGLVRTNYGFAGWSENPNTTTVQYTPGSTIELNSANPSKTLYAVWQPGLMLIANMQEMTSAGCKEGTNIGDIKQLVDTRKNTDGSTRTYWVAKLTDGNCWMTQNLDYDDPNSTRVTNTSGTNGGPASGNWSTDNATARQYWDPGEKIVSGSKLAAAGDDADRHLLVGNYYSWLSATNGTGSSVSINGDNASGSICPEGWRLPTSNTTGEFQALVSKGKSGWIAYPNTSIYGYWLGGTSATASGAAFFSANGLVNNGSLGNAGGYGYYWSSTSYSATNAYYLDFYNNRITPSSDANRYIGFSVRCVAR